MKILQQFILLFLFPLFSWGQLDSTRWLREVSVSALRLDTANSILKLDTLESIPAIKLSTNSIAGQLEREANVFIRNYGPGSLSNVSMRGTSASQTAVLWNGLQVQSPMLGLYDLTLLPSFLTGSTSIKYGGCSPTAGSGAMGGALLITSDQPHRYDAEIFGGTGSFDHQQGGIALSFGKNNLTTSTRAYYQKSKNDFPFADPEGIIKKQTNAANQQFGITQNVNLQTKKGMLALHLWYLKNKREIPPHMLTNTSKQQQDDQSIRAVADWNLQKGKINYQLTSGWSREEIIYRDPAALLNEKSTAYIFQPAALIDYKANRHLNLSVEAAAVYTKAYVDYYGAQAKNSLQETISLGLQYSKGKIGIQSAVRGGILNGKALPILPSIALHLKNHGWPDVRFEAAMLYRNPTLNDLYWHPGGNEKLQPESGFTTSASLEKNSSQKQFFLTANAGVFYTKMERLLTWLPNNAGLYSAQNINGVESKGIEGSLLVRTCFRKLNINLKGSAQYNLSILTESLPGYVTSLNKQLVYTPRVLVKTQLEFTYTKFALRYFHDYTGYRYVTQDHFYFLEPFTTGEILLAYTKPYHKNLLTAFFTVKNCWNTSYQVIAWRAMPGRYFEAGIIVGLRK